jgi:hypothetical protein
MVSLHEGTAYYRVLMGGHKPDRAMTEAVSQPGGRGFDPD